MRYGKAVRSKEGGLAKVMWSRGEQCLRFLGQPIELARFRRAAAASIDESEQLLDGLEVGRAIDRLKTN